MSKQDLYANLQVAALCTPEAKIAKLLALMAAWWEGWSLARMASVYGLSRSRVAVILRSVGCKAGAARGGRSERRGRRRASKTTPHRIPQNRIANVRTILAHPKAARLTTRQRAAVGWTALGLSSRAAAERMSITPQRVRNLLAAVEVRLRRQRRRDTPVLPGNTSDQLSALALCWDGWIELSGDNELSIPSESGGTHAG